MPKDSFHWWHLILSTKGAWLHGDTRGFRSRDHRIHSSGDYRHRPPPGEHDGLYRYHQERCPQAIIILPEHRSLLGQALVRKVKRDHYQALAISVCGMHAHLLVELPGDYEDAKAITGELKRTSSRRVTNVLPGEIWAEGGKPILVRDRTHQLEVYGYILDHADEGGWVWCFKRGVVFDPASR